MDATPQHVTNTREIFPVNLFTKQHQDMPKLHLTPPITKTKPQKKISRRSLEEATTVVITYLQNSM